MLEFKYHEKAAIVEFLLDHVRDPFPLPNFGGFMDQKKKEFDLIFSPNILEGGGGGAFRNEQGGFEKNLSE